MDTNESIISTSEHVLEVCNSALALAGYKVIEVDEDCIFIRHNGISYEIKVIVCCN